MQLSFQLENRFFLGLLEFLPEGLVALQGLVDGLAMYPCPLRRGPDIAALEKAARNGRCHIPAVQSVADRPMLATPSGVNLYSKFYAYFLGK